MGIERGQSAGAHVHRAAHGTAGKTAAQGAQQGDPATGGFMALLAALDDSLAGATDSDAGLLGEDDGGKGAATVLATDTAATASDPANTLVATAADTAALLVPDATTAAAAAAAAAALAQAAAALAGGRPAGDPSAPRAGAEAGLTGVKPALGTVAAQGAVADASAAAAAGAQPADAAALGARAADYASVFEQMHNRLAAKSAAEGSAARQSAALDAAAAAQAAKAAVTAVQDSRADRGDRVSALAATLAWTRQSAAPADAIANGTGFATASRAEERAGAPTPGGGVEGSWLQRDFTPTVQYDGTIGTGDPTATAAPDAQGADQISYWAAQGIRNAELTVAGDGSDPVQVSIAMTGNEAHVEFRSEQAGTRELLANSVADLQQMLNSEGMVLSGVSVGSSGAHGGGRESRPRPDGAQGIAPAGGRVDAAAEVPAQRASSGAVDLFV